MRTSGRAVHGVGTMLARRRSSLFQGHHQGGGGDGDDDNDDGNARGARAAVATTPGDAAEREEEKEEEEEDADEDEDEDDGEGGASPHGGSCSPSAGGKKKKRKESRHSRRVRMRPFLHSFWDMNDAVVIGSALAAYAIVIAYGTSSRPLSHAAASDLLRSLAFFRAGRPLRLLYHLPALSELLGALAESLIALSTTAVVMIFCWFAYAVVGMELFKVMTPDDVTFCHDMRYASLVITRGTTTTPSLGILRRIGSNARRCVVEFLTRRARISAPPKHAPPLRHSGVEWVLLFPRHAIHRAPTLRVDRAPPWRLAALAFAPRARPAASRDACSRRLFAGRLRRERSGTATTRRSRRALRSSASARPTARAARHGRSRPAAAPTSRWPSTTRRSRKAPAATGAASAAAGRSGCATLTSSITTRRASDGAWRRRIVSSRNDSE